MWILRTSDIRKNTLPFAQNMMDIGNHTTGIPERHTFEPVIESLLVSRIVVNSGKISGAVILCGIRNTKMLLEQDEFADVVQ